MIFVGAMAESLESAFGRDVSLGAVSMPGRGGRHGAKRHTRVRLISEPSSARVPGTE